MSKMSKTKRRSKGRKRKGGLSGTPSARSHALGWKEGLGFGVLTAAVGAGFGGIGAALGPWSIPLGAISAIYGVKRNDHLSKFFIAGGVGLIAGVTIKKMVDGQTSGIEDENDMEGFDFKAMAERAKTYYKNLGAKFALPIGKNTEGTSGLNGEDDVTYFVNPYTSNRIDTSALDRLTQQVAQMNSPVGELEISDRNF